MDIKYLVAENIGLILLVVVVLSASMVLLSLRRMIGVVRDARGGQRPWREGVSTFLGLGVGVFLLVTAIDGVRVMGPELIAQGKLQDKPAPRLTYQRVADNALAELDDHQGKVVVVNLWATWCPPCREEMPDLEKLQQNYRKNLVVLQISDENPATIAAYLDKEPMTTEHGYVESITWPIPGRPTSYVIDRSGIVREGIVGGRNYEQFESLVKRYL